MLMMRRRRSSRAARRRYLTCLAVCLSSVLAACATSFEPRTNVPGDTFQNATRIGLMWAPPCVPSDLTGRCVERSEMRLHGTYNTRPQTSVSKLAARIGLHRAIRERYRRFSLAPLIREDFLKTDPLYDVVVFKRVLPTGEWSEAPEFPTLIASSERAFEASMEDVLTSLFKNMTPGDV